MRRDKHTHGAWLKSGRTVLSVEKRHLMIAQCVKSSVAGLNFYAAIDGEEADANARLIAAAPDLLAACVEMVLHVNASQVPAEVIDAMRGAIAKAEGRQ